jgi:hypothetical protein
MANVYRPARFQLAALVFALGLSPVGHTQEVFTGTYTGTLSLTEVCSDGSDTQAVELTFTVTASATGFSGEGTYIEDEPGDTDTGSFTLEGGSSGGSAGGQVFGEIFVDPDDEDVNQVGHFEATFSDDFTTLELSLDAADDGPPNCTFHGSGTFTLVEEPGEGVVDPGETASSVVTAPVILKTQVQAITTGLNARINDIVRGIGGGPRTGQRVTANGVYQGVSGLAAGEDGPSYGVWASYSYSDFDNDFVATLLDGHRHNVLLGADLTPRDNMVLGFAVGYEFSSIDTDFNGGEQDTDGFTVAPYFGLILSEAWNVSASVGYSSLDTDQFRIDPVLGTRIDSDPDSDRWFGTLNLNGYTTWNNWLFTGRIGMLHARSVQKAFDESDGTAVARFTTELGQWNIGGEAAYSFESWEPFARLTYERDYSLTRITLAGTGPQPSDDDDNVLFGLGLRYFSMDNGLSGNIEWYKRFGREDYDEDTFSATVRWEF